MQNFTYYSEWKDTKITCTNCRWEGLGSECEDGEFFRDLEEKNCPSCHGRLFTVEYPTLNEMRANWDKLNRADKLQYELITRHQEKFRETSLKSTDQLPELEGDDLVLTWDIEDRQSGGNTLIKFGDRVIWKETAFFEGYKRFIKVAEILKKKYGNSLQDLVPTRKSKLYLYGDYGGSIGAVESCREKLAKMKLPHKETN